ncbi:MAG: RNA methyltransferase [Chloroflexota bacterium]
MPKLPSPMITSSNNPKLKTVRLLAGRAKDRREQQAFLAEGVRLVEEALASEWPFRFTLYSDELGERGRKLLARIQQRGIETDEVSTRLLGSLSETETSQGILAVLADEGPRRVQALNFVLITDAVRDPGNLGTLLRTAEAAGVDAVFLTPGSTDAFAPKVVRAGMGAHFRLPLYEVSWDEIKTQVAAYHWNVYLADMHGQSCWEVDFHPPLALIIGGEAEGATAAARGLATQTVSIPMQGRAESLNAAVAGAVLMFEVKRQRDSNTKGTK